MCLLGRRVAGACWRPTVLLMAVAALLAWPGTVHAGASAWPLEHDAAIITAFGARYETASGSSSTHRGVDLCAEPGDAVVSPCTGSVTFAGRVPAVGSSGTVLACTIERSDGVRFTLMPLEVVSVSAGQGLVAGTRVGEVASRGDASSPQSHLHVGVRRGDLYVDPLQFLVAPTAVSEPAREPAPSPAPAAVAPSVLPREPVVVRPPEPVSVPSAPPVVVPTGAAPVDTLAPAQREADAERLEVAETVSNPGSEDVSDPVHGGSVVSGLGRGISAPSIQPPFPSRLSPTATGAMGPSVASPGALAAYQDAPEAAGIASPSFAPLIQGTGIAPGVPPAAKAVPEIGGSSAFASGDARGHSTGQSAARQRATARTRFGDLLALAASRGASFDRGTASRLGRAWLVSLVALLAAAGALWPLWRREPADGEPARCVVPVGSEVAAATGR